MLNEKSFPFNHSVNSVVSCFDLIRIDIWDLISNPFVLENRYLLTIIKDHNKFLFDIFDESQV